MHAPAFEEGRLLPSLSSKQVTIAASPYQLFFILLSSPSRAYDIRRYYVPLAAFFCIILPTLVPYYCWSETFLTSFMMAGMARYCVSLHITWLVNSAAHLWGNQPYDENIGARQNPYVSFGSMGEGNCPPASCVLGLCADQLISAPNRLAQLPSRVSLGLRDL